jgi:hypothetical protein
MDHEEAVRQEVTEKYLLHELDPDVRDQFEEHLFDCTDCALDLRAAAMFVEQSKVVLAEETAAVRVPVPVPASRGWLGQTWLGQTWNAWLRPAFAVPVMALLLAVIGYQNFFTYPQLKAMNQPQLLPATLVTVSTRSATRPVIAVRPGSGFLLSLRIPPEAAYASYTADLLNPAGGLEWSLTIPANPTEDTYNVRVPAASRESGTYTVKVHGVTAAGQSSDVGVPAPFEVHVQK